MCLGKNKEEIVAAYSESHLASMNAFAMTLMKLDQTLSRMSEQLIVTIPSCALDDKTREFGEASIDQTNLPKYDQTIEYLQQRVILERWEEDSVAAVSINPKVSNRKQPVPMFVLFKYHMQH